MQSFNLRVLFPFFHLAAVVLAIPVFGTSPPALFPRMRRGQPTCANSPGTIAGTTLVDPAAKNPLHPRSPQLIPTLSRHIPLAISPRRSTSSFLWCAPNSRTFVTLRPLRILSEVAVMDLLDEAYSLTQSYIREYGDEVIWGGVFDWTTNGLHLRMQNANNHQLTFGVLGAALYAVSDFMTKNEWSAATFRVWDGEAWVGAGTVG